MISFSCVPAQFNENSLGRELELMFESPEIVKIKAVRWYQQRKKTSNQQQDDQSYKKSFFVFTQNDKSY